MPRCRLCRYMSMMWKRSHGSFRCRIFRRACIQLHFGEDDVGDNKCALVLSLTERWCEAENEWERKGRARDLSDGEPKDLQRRRVRPPPSLPPTSCLPLSSSSDLTTATSRSMSVSGNIRQSSSSSTSPMSSTEGILPITELP